MASPLPGDDDTLLAELLTALRTDTDAVERAVTAGQAAWTWRTVEAELAALTRDSWRLEDGFALARDDGERRTLVFEGTTGSVEVQVHGDRVVGQLLPPVPGRVELVMLSGPGAVVTADEVGCFALDLPAGGPWRLRCTRDTDALVTTWVDPDRTLPDAGWMDR